MLTVNHVVANIVIQKSSLSHVCLLWLTHFVCYHPGYLRSHNHLHAHFVSDMMSLCRFHRRGGDDARCQDPGGDILLDLEQSRHNFSGRPLCLFYVCLAHGIRSRNNSLAECRRVEQAHLAILGVKAGLWRDQSEWRFLCWVTEFHLVFNITYRLLVFWIQFWNKILEWSINLKR